jgi:Ca2+:H+ antiporter
LIATHNDPQQPVARLLARKNWLLLLLIFFPVALLLEYVFHAGALWVFLASSATIIPLAALMGRATEQLAERLGEGVGGLLNATFGNAAELIIAIVALRAGLFDLVKASITGSIIGNLLLVFGASALWGGLRFQTQKFNRTAAGLSATLLVLSAVALFIPAVFHLVVEPGAGVAERTLSVEIAAVLIITYVPPVPRLQWQALLPAGQRTVGPLHRCRSATVRLRYSAVPLRPRCPLWCSPRVRTGQRRR